jgi:hypothetical protein
MAPQVLGRSSATGAPKAAGSATDRDDPPAPELGGMVHDDPDLSDPVPRVNGVRTREQVGHRYSDLPGVVAVDRPWAVGHHDPLGGETASGADLKEGALRRLHPDPGANQGDGGTRQAHRFRGAQIEAGGAGRGAHGKGELFGTIDRLDEDPIASGRHDGSRGRTLLQAFAVGSPEAGGSAARYRATRRPSARRSIFPSAGGLLPVKRASRDRVILRGTE